MADITQLRFAQLLRRTFGLKGGGEPGRVIAPVIGASYDIGDPYHPEDRALRGERLWTIVNSQSNVGAGNFGVLTLRNPTGSGRIAVVKRATWSFLQPTATAQPGLVYLGIKQATADPGAGGSGSVLKDGRYGLAVTNGAVGFQTGALAATPTTTFFTTAVYYVQIFPGAATVPFIHQVDNLDIVAPPGTANNFVALADTATVTSWFWQLCVEGYDRVADPNELILPPP